MWRGIKACQKKKKTTAVQIILCDKRGLQVRRAVFLFKPNFKRLRKAGQTSSLIFYRARLTLAAPRRHTWQWQMRQCVEEVEGGLRGVGGGVLERGWLLPPGETLTHWPRLVASWCWPPPGPGAASVSTHFHTWTNTETGQEKQPTHPYLSSLHLLLPTPHPPHPRALYLGHRRLPSDPLVLLFLHFLIPLFATSPQLAVPYTGLSKKHFLLYYGCMYLTVYILGYLFTTPCTYG